MRLLLALVLAAPLRAQTVDLSDQFPERACGDQGSIAACHAFASVALLEAAIRRGGGGSGGPRRRLSEADLFVRAAVADPEYYSLLMKASERFPESDFRVAFFEAGSVSKDLTFALEHGVATSDSTDWETVRGRYERYRREAARAIEERKKACAALGQAAEAVRAVDPAACERLRYDSNLHLRAYLASMAEQNRRSAVAELLGTGPELESERAETRRLLEGRSVRGKDLPEQGRDVRSDAVRCREEGKDVERGLSGLLDSGLPVAVTMNISGLARWRRAGRDEDDWHVFVVSGYERREDGLAVFKTRNSWAGLNPDVPPEDLCRIRAAVWLKD